MLATPHRPRARWVLAAVAVAATASAVVVSMIMDKPAQPKTDRAESGVTEAVDACPLIATDWGAGRGEYDYLQALDLNRDGSGAYVYGYSQAIRLDLSFAVRVRGDEIEMSQFVSHDPFEQEPDRELDWPPQQTRFVIETGDFVVDHPYLGREHYRCRLTLSPQPFDGTYDEYLGRKIADPSE